ncbi:MAG: PIN domain-containing protein [Candidatus Moraniibacteriota bacterium]
MSEKRIGSARRVFVCDTNVLINDPRCLQRQQKTIRIHFHIPFSVMHELRKISQERGTRRGYNAKYFLGCLRDFFDGEPSGIIEINKGKNFLSIGEKQDSHPQFLIRYGRKNSDFWILNSAFRIKTENPSVKVFLKTEDKKLIRRADRFGIYAGPLDNFTKQNRRKNPINKKGGGQMTRKKNGHPVLFAR